MTSELVLPVALPGVWLPLGPEQLIGLVNYLIKLSVSTTFLAY